MLRDKKPAPLKPPENVIEFVVKERDKHICQSCGVYTGEQPPHHWGVHNKKENRAAYPLLVHHPANLILWCPDCHSKHGSGDNLPEYRARAIELYLSVGGDCYLQIEEDGTLSIITTGDISCGR